MHDQNSIDQSETPSQKYQRALDLFTESVLAPDHKLRGCAHNQEVLGDNLTTEEYCDMMEDIAQKYYEGKFPNPLSLTTEICK